MGFITIHRLNKFYQLYRNLDVTFSNDVVDALRFKKDRIFVRGSGGQWPCIVNSASMVGATIICSTTTDLYQQVKAEQVNLSLRFAFEEEKDIMTFFVPTKAVDVSLYDSEKKGLILVTLEYTQRAPDDLIERLGLLLEANANSTKRKAERLTLTNKSIHKINLLKRESFIFIKGIPRRCILLDISFSGVKLIMVGVANFLVNSETTVKFDFEKPSTRIGVKGKIIRAEKVEGRKDLVALAIEFKQEEVPIIFKMHLNKYFGNQKPSTESKEPTES